MAENTEELVKIANFHAPDFMQGMKAYNAIVNYMSQCPYIFYPEAKLYTVYGCFSSCIWNGGTLFCGASVSSDAMEDIINHYNYNLHIPLTFTFTNPLIKNQNELDDIYSNTIAELGNNGMNFINVASPVLEEYLKKHYKNYKYNRSIVASEHKPYDLDGYNISVLQRAKNNDWDYLNTIPMEDRGRIELLLNDPCPDNCKLIYQHYKWMAELQIKNSLRDEHIDCVYPSFGSRARMILNNKTYISTDQLYNQYLPAGFQHFKFSGRNSVVRIVSGILSYMITPLYHEDLLAVMFHDYHINTWEHLSTWREDGFFDL